MMMASTEISTGKCAYCVTVFLVIFQNLYFTVKRQHTYTTKLSTNHKINKKEKIDDSLCTHKVMHALILALIYLNSFSVLTTALNTVDHRPTSELQNICFQSVYHLFASINQSINQSINIRLLTRKCQNALSDRKWVK